MKLELLIFRSSNPTHKNTKTITGKDKCTFMFTEALFIIVQDLKTMQVPNNRQVCKDEWDIEYRSVSDLVRVYIHH